MAIGTLSPEARTELIRKKAFALFLERGSSHGQDMNDWLRAEKLVDAEVGGKSAQAPGGTVVPNVKISAARGAETAPKETFSSDRGKRRAAW